MTAGYDFDEQYAKWLTGEPWVAGSWSSSNVPAFEARKLAEVRDCSCQAEAEARGLA